MRVCICQINPVVGDIYGNLARIRGLAEAHGHEADLLVFPELALTGYPPRDLLDRRTFVDRAGEALTELARASRGWPAGVIVGLPVPADAGPGKPLRNSAALLHDGEVVALRHKSLLPSYDVFDEERYFRPAAKATPVPFRNEMLGITVCEDAWTDEALWGRALYDRDPVAELVAAGASLIINISASPFDLRKWQRRCDLFTGHARRHGTAFLFVNQVGANDELIFDGTSLCLDRGGAPITVLPAFEEAVRIVDTDADGGTPWTPPDEVTAIRDALVLGIRDYTRKCDFHSGVVGLSGGIDSAVTCALAVEALGPEHVLGVSMPGPYSSPGSVEDSRTLARKLGIAFHVIPISPLFEAYGATLAELFADTEADETEENLQARIRGAILMALSNKFGHLVLSTGNKSELAVGYTTLYGDLLGGLAVLSDVLKTSVYALARAINAERQVIPRSILEKPPSAELRPDQMDQDTLPPYEILDRVLVRYLDDGWSPERLLTLDVPRTTVAEIVRLVDRNEYKRRQAPPGLKITSKAFGTGRRMPIAARFGTPG